MGRKGRGSGPAKQDTVSNMYQLRLQCVLPGVFVSEVSCVRLSHLLQLRHGLRAGSFKSGARKGEPRRKGPKKGLRMLIALRVLRRTWTSLLLFRVKSFFDQATVKCCPTDTQKLGCFATIPPSSFQGVLDFRPSVLCRCFVLNWMGLGHRNQYRR